MSAQQPLPSVARRFAGRLAIACLLMVGPFAGVTARAGETPAPIYYDVQMTLEANGHQSSPRVVTRAGDTFSIEEKGLFKGDFVVTPFDDPDHPVKLTATITNPLGGYWQQLIVARLGEEVSLGADTVAGNETNKGYHLTIVINEAKPPANPGQ